MPEIEDRLARTVLSQNLRVRRGETVLIETWSHTLPEARAFVREARRLGARPTVLYEDEKAWWETVEARRLAPFATLSPAERAALEAADVYVYFWGPEDLPRRDRLPDRIRQRATGFNEEWYRVAEKAGVRGCRMTLAQATDPAARAFGLDGRSWRRRMMEAGAVNGPRLRALGLRVARAIERGRHLSIRHPNGTDLKVRLSGVHTRIDAGVVDAAARKRKYGMLANNPSGQVMVAIDSGRADGTLVTNRSVYIGPHTFGGIRWVLSDGRLVEHRYRTGGKVFDQEFDAAPEGKDRFGFLSIGLNPRSRDLPPCEDTEEGSVLVGVGGNGMAGGRRRIPFMGAALIGGATLEVDGKVVASGGRIR